MKKTETLSSKPAPSLGSSPMSGGSIFRESPPSPIEFSPPPQPEVLRQVSRALRGMRNEDFARWSGYAIEDMGILEPDKLFTSVDSLGLLVRTELMPVDSFLSPDWIDVSHRLLRLSPGASNPNVLIAVLCQLATVKLFLEGTIDARP